MRKNNKALYEKIMQNVAKEVKRALNEDTEYVLKDNPEAVERTIVRLFQNHNMDYVSVNPEIDDYYNDAMLDDLGEEVSYFTVKYDNTLRVGIWNKEIDINKLSAQDLDTLYYIARNIVADEVGNFDEVSEEIENIYKTALDGTIHLGYKMNDEDKERLYKAFEECGYEECDFLKMDGEPVVLDSVYKDKNVSIDIISCNLACRLSSTEFNEEGETINLEDIINDSDDIDTLEEVIADYEE